jgi:hypothetical protein
VLEAKLDSKHFENQLKVFSSGLGGIFKELLADVGKQMVDEVKSNASSAFTSRTGKLAHAVNFISFDEKVGVLTTRKTLNKANVYYARFVENGANIKAKKGKYLTFKVNGEWKKVESVRTRPRPFMTPVFNDYFESEGGKGYKLLADALERKMESYLK